MSAINQKSPDNIAHQKGKIIIIYFLTRSSEKILTLSISFVITVASIWSISTRFGIAIKEKKKDVRHTKALSSHFRLLPLSKTLCTVMVPQMMIEIIQRKEHPVIGLIMLLSTYIPLEYTYIYMYSSP